MAYTPTIWKDGQAPAINAENLNKIEQGIANADTAANQALEAAQGAGMKITKVFDQGSGAAVTEVNISSVSSKAIFFIAVCLTGSPTQVIEIIIPANMPLGTTNRFDGSMTIVNKTGSNAGDWTIDVLYYELTSTLLKFAGQITPGGPYTTTKTTISRLYAVY